MALIRYRPRRDWDPFARLQELQDEMSRLFDWSLTHVPVRDAGVISIATDIYEEKDNIIVKAELPGLTRDDIEILLQDNVLTLRGEKKSETEVKEENFYRMERSYGKFERSFELPAKVDPNKVAATFKDGVLRITLPKSEEAKPKQIKVNVS
jgi:HSP20 family protein